VVCVIQGYRSACERAGIRVSTGSHDWSGVSYPSLCTDVTPCISVYPENVLGVTVAVKEGVALRPVYEDVLVAVYGGVAV
jgi:hypothetical protein